ncbi:hypothetical protein [Thermostaphylospora chromogena]|uniref:Mce-associated membrane protein n=1 Tax=Thermostaphylospora chromogena TaxID=35622 RepID=A0A1H1E2R0_9ACTN|nr:hypothetical protein [Thermostaphylospora chromogena]SDQ82759.1 Mce-associated membrane protein [Thermostaphylospora chromogena]
MKAVVLAVLSGLALVLGGVGFHLCGALEEANDAAEDRRAAVQVAKAHAMHLMSISHDSVDQDIRRLLATSTGPAKEAYTRNAAKLKATTVDDKVVQTGVLRAAGLVSMEGGVARVLVVADVLIRWEGSKTPAQERFYRWDMKVTKVGGTWLVSEAEQVQ